MASEAQEALRSLSDEFTKFQQEQQKLVSAQQRLNAQKTENESVKKEFDKLKEGEVIYKLVGPVLLKQEKIEADSTVKGRLDFINKELERLEKEIKAIDPKMNKIKEQIIALQSGAQAAPAAKAGGQ